MGSNPTIQIFTTQQNMYHVRQQPMPTDSKETYLLIKFECDYADEFDVEGFATWKRSEWGEHVKDLKNISRAHFPVEWYFGTNEFCEYDSPDDVLSNFKVTEITKEQYDVIQACFRGGRFGKLPCLGFEETDWYV